MMENIFRFQRQCSILIIGLLLTSHSFAQPATTCSDIAAYMNNIHRRYYPGTPVWQTKMDSAILLCPSSARVYGDRAAVYLLRGDVATWAQWTEKAIAHNPIYYYGDRGIDRLRFLRDYKGALKDFQIVDSLNGHHSIFASNVHIYIWIAQCKEGLGDLPGALQYYDQGIDKQVKEQGEGWVGMYDYLLRGILKLAMSKPEEALVDFDLQLKQYDKLADAYYYRGMAYKKLGQQEKAQPDFARAKELLTGQGTHRWDWQFNLVHEINMSDVDRELLN